MPVYKLTNPKWEHDDSIIVRCDCSGSEHELTIYPWHDFDEDRQMAYAVTFCLLMHHNIFSRIWLALKYVFGRYSRHGYFDEIILVDSDFVEIFKFFEKHRKDIK